MLLWLWCLAQHYPQADIRFTEGQISKFDIGVCQVSRPRPRPDCPHRPALEGPGVALWITRSISVGQPGDIWAWPVDNSGIPVDNYSVCCG
nr:MAG TPA: hypothetical protein [Caudoviricetes sp.]